MNDWRFLLSGIIINSFLVGCIAASIISIKRLSLIDMGKNSIVITRQMFLRYKKQENRNFIAFLFTIPPVIIAFLSLGQTLYVILTFLIILFSLLYYHHA
jgi:hypothetical protein